MNRGLFAPFREQIARIQSIGHCLLCQIHYLKNVTITITCICCTGLCCLNVKHKICKLTELVVLKINVLN